jgi:hypothetical protein
VAGSGQYPISETMYCPGPCSDRRAAHEFIQPFCSRSHIAYSAAATAVTATAMEKTSCLRIVIIDKEPEWAIKM